MNNINIYENKVILIKNELYKIVNCQDDEHISIRKLELDTPKQYKYIEKDVMDCIKNEHLIHKYPNETYQGFKYNFSKNSKTKKISKNKIIGNNNIFCFWDVDEIFLDEEGKLVFASESELNMRNSLRWLNIVCNCRTVIKYYKQWRLEQLFEFAKTFDGFSTKILTEEDKEILNKLMSEFKVPTLKSSENECPICLDVKTVCQGYFNCSHVVCTNCYELCKSKTCSLCRSY
jgi:hypothetical protein